MNRPSNGFFLLSTSISSGKKGLAERLANLGRREKRRWYALAVTLLLALGLAACSFGGAPPTAVPEDELTTPTTVPMALLHSDVLYASSEEAAAAYMQADMDNIGPWYEGPEGPARKFAFIESDITRWELVGNYQDILTDDPLEVYALEYRLLADDPSQIMLAGGMSMDGDKLTQSCSLGDPLLVLWPVDGGYRYLGTVWTSQIASDDGFDRELEKEVLRLLYRPRKIDREWDSEIKLYMEGQTETMSAYLYTDIGCSLYYADENLQVYDNWSSDMPELLQVDYGEGGICYLTLSWQQDQPFITSETSAQSDYWNEVELNDGTPATHYYYSEVAGDPAYNSDVYQIAGPLGWYIITCVYPDEAAEGWGARLTAMAFTFQLDGWPDKEDL